MRIRHGHFLPAVLVLSALLTSGCSSSSSPKESSAEAESGAVPADASEEGVEPPYIQQILDSTLGQRITGMPDGTVHRPQQGKPLGASPCRLMEADGGADITDKQKATRKPVPVPALYELRSERVTDGFSVSTYVLPRNADKAKVLGAVLAAAKDCGSRTATAPISAVSRSSAVVTTAAQLTSGKHGPGVAVLSEASAAGSAPPGPSWTIGPDGKLAPIGDLPAPGSGAVEAAFTYGQAVVYGTNGRFLVEVLSIADDDPVNPDPAAEDHPSAPAYTEAQETLTTVLSGFQGIPD
ncbi:hypothetical protein ACFYOV_28560 [Streptomyces sp. NPDC005931]|uniref:hypothetical protein n=1 Tax=Streptomyces sp. NPDC005931 TaxID=3364737 RepID=UPI0036AB515B